MNDKTNLTQREEASQINKESKLGGYLLPSICKHKKCWNVDEDKICRLCAEDRIIKLEQLIEDLRKKSKFKFEKYTYGNYFKQQEEIRNDEA
jgi:hypothetical protein